MRLYNTSRGILLEQADRWVRLPESDWDALINHEALAAHLDRLGRTLPASAPPDLVSEPALPPMQGQELWASGVTYLRSKVERQEESKDAGGADFYQRVYDAQRPELFFKGTRHRVVGHGGKVRMRRDSTWNVPEPELALYINSKGSIQGYTIGNDVSSRSIEGENALYLPQAKVFEKCAGLGPCLYVPEQPVPKDTAIKMSIYRSGGAVYNDETSISRMKRSHTELAGFLYRECDFPAGSFLMTGTCLVPPNNFTLQPGDVVSISIDHIGTLVNPVSFKPLN